MSKAGPLFSKKELLSLALPLLLEQLLTMMMGTVDTLMVSSVGEAAVSGISLVESLDILVLQILAALATSGTVIVSQYLGRQDRQHARQASGQLYTVTLALGLILSAAVCTTAVPMLRLIFGAIDRNVMSCSQIYFSVVGLSYPAIGMYYAGTALFRAQGNSKIGLYSSLAVNLINVGGNALMIYGLRLGVLGAAIATLTARSAGAAYMVKCQKENSELSVSAFSDLRPDRYIISKIVRIAFPSSLENGIFHIGKILVSSVVAGLGTSAIAAFAVANSLTGLSVSPGLAMSTAMIPVVGRCLGAGDKVQARHFAMVLQGTAMGILLLCYLLLWVLLPGLLPLYRLSETAASLCVRSCHVFALSAAPFWAFSFVLPGAMRAGGDVKFTMAVSIVSMFLCRVLLAAVFVRTASLGLIGVWLGMAADFIFRTAFFIPRFFSGRWIHDDVI
ncbi:MAG: MATE family efflux transporter [Bacillota bacterium]|nr:MATE family efflux transporter [Bacillota bacterium]